ncbi:hypothetical protein V1527DRAFT_478083 [Lipomyces starkeyi]
MEQSYQKLHMTATKAREVWRTLEKQFALIWSASKPRLMCKLYSTKMKNETKLEDHLSLTSLHMLRPDVMASHFGESLKQRLVHLSCSVECYARIVVMRLGRSID